jgi:hypothetical protein
MTRLKFFIAIVCYCILLIYKDTNENMMLHPKALAGTIQCKLFDCQGEIIRMGRRARAHSARLAAAGARYKRIQKGWPA